MVEIQNTFRELLANHSMPITDRQLEQFEIYYRLLVEWNERMNLTAITEREQVFLKHYYDSISVAFFYPLSEVRSVADIGSGAGFPGIPLKILFPHIQLTIVDSLHKRITFLQTLITALGLEHVQCVHARAEDAGRSQEHRDRYDVVTARALARLAGLSELCLPFVKPEGAFIAMKGANAAEEIEEGRYAIKQLAARVETEHSFQLPGDLSHRHLIIMRKTGVTPTKYPRKAGTPLKSPLLRL